MQYRDSIFLSNTYCTVLWKSTETIVAQIRVRNNDHILRHGYVRSTGEYCNGSCEERCVKLVLIMNVVFSGSNDECMSVPVMPNVVSSHDNAVLLGSRGGCCLAWFSWWMLG